MNHNGKLNAARLSEMNKIAPMTSAPSLFTANTPSIKGAVGDPRPVPLPRAKMPSLPNLPMLKKKI